MKVLLSIKPEFADKIFDGSKKYEYRRVIFKNPLVDKVVVYASTPTCMIVGEFGIEKIIYEDIPVLWELRKDEQPAADAKAFFEYFAGKTRGYAIKVKTATKYDKPLTLGTFGISLPPQSFTYLAG